jgi:hypothetical protein
MILILNAFITDNRCRGNRHRRIDIFRYTLYSYRNIKFNKIYIFILLDKNYIKHKNDLISFIYNNFSSLSKENIIIEFNRFYKQCQWELLITSLYSEFGGNIPVMFLNNDDHVFIDYNNTILDEGIELISNENNKHKSIYFSHWTEILLLSGKYNQPERNGNYIKFNLTVLDSIQIFNLEFLFYILVTYKWKNDHIRIDTLLYEITDSPYQNNILNQVIYVPLKELFRKFDGYNHVNMIEKYCPPLILPYNKFNYDKDTLINKMTAYHNSAWTKDNNFHIPQEWIDINLSLHDTDYYELFFVCGRIW